MILSKKNSLNNRFMTYREFSTDAILSVDDDVCLMKNQISFLFDVWKNNRNRIVGYAGRSHGWSGKKWIYIPGIECQLSLVLTGFAFIHRFYLQLYETSMPDTIRKIVDKYQNCEDIAMNFLVSHLTREPNLLVYPIVFSCHYGPNSQLHIRAGHYEMRSKCIDLYTKVNNCDP